MYGKFCFHFNICQLFGDEKTQGMRTRAREKEQKARIEMKERIKRR